jgi:hypothetical protein
MAMPPSGPDFRDKVVKTVREVLAEMGLQEVFEIKTECPSPHGSLIREQGRKVDVALLDRKGRPYLFLECKWQSVSGSAQDKLFRAVEEARRDRLFGVHSVVVVGGEGFASAIKRWALTEGLIHESFLKDWLREFFKR